MLNICDCRLRIDEPIDYFRHHRLHLGRVIDAERRVRGAQNAKRLGVPGFVARLAKNPIDDRSAPAERAGCVERVRRDVVFPPHLAPVVRQDAVAGGDAGNRLPAGFRAWAGGSRRLPERE